LPLAVLYFRVAARLPLAQVGLGLTLGTAGTLVLLLPAGSIIDRWRARNVVIACHLVRAVCFLAYASVHSFPLFLGIAFVTALCNRIAMPANQALIADVAQSSERDSWYGLWRVLLNAGLGVGSLLTTVLVSVGGLSGYRAAVLINAVSYLLAAALLAGVRSGARPQSPAASFGYRSLIRDVRYLVFTATGPVLGLSALVLQVALPPYLVETLRGPVWPVGLLVALNTVIVVAIQVPLLAILSRYSRLPMLALGACAYGLSFGLYGAALVVPRPFLILYLALATVVYTFGEVLFMPLASAFVADAGPPHLRGRYLTSYEFTITVGRTIAPLLSTSLVVVAPTALWTLLLGLCLVAAAICVGLIPVSDERSARRH
jgi:MFS family permease